MSEPARTTADGTGEVFSAAAGLEPFEWNQDEAIAYEVAIDTIGLVIANYTGLIADEKRSGAPDAVRVQEFEEGITRAAADQRALVGKAPDEVERVTATYAVRLRQLPKPLPRPNREKGAEQRKCQPRPVE